MFVQSQGPQSLRVGGGDGWGATVRLTALLFLLSGAWLPQAGCGFGVGRHSDENRNRSMKCARTLPCSGASQWDDEHCRCVHHEAADGGATGVADASSFDLGSGESQENEDGSQGLD